MQKYARRTTRILMGRRNHSAPFPPGPSINVTKPTIEKFYLDFDDELNSDFNRTSLSLIVDHTITLFPRDFSDADRPTLTKAAHAHLVHLRDTYHAQFDQESLARRIRLAKKTTRKRQVSWYRRSLRSTRKSWLILASQ